MFDTSFLDNALEVAARADFLKEKYEAELKKRKFEWERVLSADPTNNKEYLQWIIKQILVNKFKDEDLYKMRESLTLFNKFKSKLDVEHRDINKITNYASLYNLVKPYEGKKTKNESDKDFERLLYEQDEATLVYNDATTKVVIPKTHKASCYFGINTRWCTATRDDASNFKRYSKKSPLYIILDKKNNKRYQFWFSGSGNQLMDEQDVPIAFHTVNPVVFKNMVRLFKDQAKKYHAYSLMELSEAELVKLISEGKAPEEIGDHPNITDNVLIQLINKGKYRQLQGILNELSSVSKKVHTEILGIKSDAVAVKILQAYAVSRGDFPKDLYDEVLKKGDIGAIIRLAKKKNVSRDLFDAIVEKYGDDERVRSALVSNTKVPKDILDKLSDTVEVREKRAEMDL